MSNVNIPVTARKALVTLRKLRNGKYPEVQPVTFMQEETNRIAAYRTKSWSFTGTAAATSGFPSLVRWRAFIHTSSHCRHAWVRFLAVTTGTTGSPVCRVTFTIPGAGSAAAIAEFEYDPNVDGYDVGMVGTSDGVAPVDLLPDQDYEVAIVDASDSAITASVCIWEQSLKHTTENGYIRNGVVVGQDIVDAHRQDMVSMARDLWLVNGSPLITWSSESESDAYTANSTTPTNILDGSSTSVSAATPGWTIDLRHRSTLRRAADGVPVIMQAYCGAGTGTVRLMSSGGGVLATCTVSGASADWYSSGVFYLPATKAKYDIMARIDTVGTMDVIAVSLYSASDI